MIEIYEEFEKVKRTNNVVSRVLESGGTLEHCIVALDIYATKLEDRLFQLQMIVPKKIRVGNATTYIWRCPDELIPEETIP